MTDTPFLAAHAEAETWQLAVGEVIPKLRNAGAEHRLGIVYVGPNLAAALGDIEVLLRQSTGVPHWVGTVGYGTVGVGTDGGLVESFGASSLSVLLCPFEEQAFRVFSGARAETDRVTARHAEWLSSDVPPVVLAHGDPGNGLIGGLLEDIGQETDGFLLGGLAAAQGRDTQIADGPDGKGLSGALLSPAHIEIQTALSQGCGPIGGARTVTAGDGQVILELDGRPALEVFKEDIGEILARDLNRCAGYIFAALPVEGSDSGDYTVRNLLALDPESGAMAVAAHLAPGDRVLFCRRDPSTAVDDMRRMLTDLKGRIGERPVRGGLYVSCAARGPNQFSDPATETQLIQEALGAFPLTGFFANGEFSRDRVYAYTGVLTLFL
jgi:small ligand-binding sensory domain FIST